MAGQVISKIKAGDDSVNLVAQSAYFYCDTAAATVAKVAKFRTTDQNAFVPIEGTTINVRFLNSNTADSPTLTLQTSGGTQVLAAKPIYRHAQTVPGKNTQTSWPANGIVSLTYDTTVNASGCWIVNNYKDGDSLDSDMIRIFKPTDIIAGDTVEDHGYDGGVILVRNSSTSKTLIDTSGLDFTSEENLVDALGEYNYYLTKNDIHTDSSLTETSRNDYIILSKTNGDTHYCTSTTGASTAAKVATVSGSSFKLVKGTRVSVYFSTANTYASGALTLNVSSTGAKTIYVNGAATSSSNRLPWDAKTVMDFIYNGTYWYYVGSSAGGIYVGTVTPAQANFWIEE